MNNKDWKADFECVYYVTELKYNLFSVSQFCDSKKKVLCTETWCFILSSDFKMPIKGKIILKIPRKDNTYNVAVKDIVPSRGLTCVGC